MEKEKSVASDLGLHCLLSPVYLNIRINLVNCYSDNNFSVEHLNPVEHQKYAKHINFALNLQIFKIGRQSDHT